MQRIIKYNGKRIKFITHGEGQHEMFLSFELKRTLQVWSQHGCQSRHLAGYTSYTSLYLVRKGNAGITIDHWISDDEEQGLVPENLIKIKKEMMKEPDIGAGAIVMSGKEMIERNPLEVKNTQLRRMIAFNPSPEVEL